MLMKIFRQACARCAHNRWMSSCFRFVVLCVLCVLAVAPWPAWAQSADSANQPPAEACPRFVLQREYGWKIAVPAYAFASYVAISRMSENKHYASDVAFGAAIGIVSARAIRIHRGEHDLAVSPMAAPGGAGVSVAWLPSLKP